MFVIFFCELVCILVKCILFSLSFNDGNIDSFLLLLIVRLWFVVCFICFDILLNIVFVGMRNGVVIINIISNMKMILMIFSKVFIIIFKNG